MSPLRAFVTTVALIPFAVAFCAGVVVWGVARDLQRTAFGRIPAVRRVLVGLAGDASAESEAT